MDLDPKLNRPPEKLESVHLMGIGGVAMGALAGGLKRQGLAVRGSDQPLYPPMSTFLEELGIDVAQGYDAANLEPAPDLVIVGNVIRRDNPETQALAASGLPYLSLPQALGHFFIRDRISIVAAGTHGKTTTSAILASSLEAAGLDPGYLVGGIMNHNGGNFHDGTGRHFVVEGDEYDTAFFNKVPKFVHYRPRIAILTSVEFDHADIYADMDSVREAFNMLMEIMPPDGVLIAMADSDEVMAQARRTRCRVVTYGLGDSCDWRLISAQPASQGGAQLRVRTPDGMELDFYSPLAGEHNALNTTAALVALVEAGLSPEKAAGLQKGFKGVRRRQQVLGQAGGVVVVDDFAHHPTAVHETVRAVARFGLPGWSHQDGRLVAIFEPRTNTSKRNFFQNDYAEAFGGADLVFLKEPPADPDIEPKLRFSSQRLAGDLNAKDLSASSFADTDALLQALLAQLKPGDLALVMSNGSFDGLHGRLMEGLTQSA